MGPARARELNQRGITRLIAVRLRLRTRPRKWGEFQTEKDGNKRVIKILSVTTVPEVRSLAMVAERIRPVLAANRCHASVNLCVPCWFGFGRPEAETHG